MELSSINRMEFQRKYKINDNKGQSNVRKSYLELFKDALLLFRLDSMR